MKTTPSISAVSVLMIDDDRELFSLVRELLGRDGIVAAGAATLAEGLDWLGNHDADVLILDLMLPDGHGLDFCRHLRQSGNAMPVLMLTAKGDPMDRVLGLEIGADDYLGKPFEPRELVARIRALARRKQSMLLATQLRFDGMVIDLLARRVSCGEALLPLTSSEFKLLVALASSPGVPVSRDALSAAVQPGSYAPLERAVDVQVARLRRKLPATAQGDEWIETVRGEGYVFIGRKP